jgi:hypothetical protein
MIAAKDALAAAKTGANTMLGSTDTFLATDWKVFNFGADTSTDINDLNRVVTGLTTGFTGTLRGWDSTRTQWYVEPTNTSQVFNVAEVIRVSPSNHGGNLSAVPVLLPPPYGEALRTARNTFDGVRRAIDTADAAAAIGVTDHSGVYASVTATSNVKTGDANIAKTTLTNKEAAYAVAQATTQTAFANLSAAYYAVKAVCPTWSPIEPFPPQP